MAATYEAIATVEVGAGGASYIEFTSIPATYTDLVVKASLRDSGSNNWFLVTFNGNTSSAYTQKQLWGENTTFTSLNRTPRVNFFYDAITDSTHTASTFNSFEMYIPNYTASTYKAVSTESVSENNTAAKGIRIMSGDLFSDTATITSIKLTQTLAQYSTATLYGIKNS